MSAFLHWLTSPEWALVVKTLLHSLWQGALIAAALAVVLRRIARPDARYHLTVIALGAVVLAAVITWGVLTAPTTPVATLPPQQQVQPAVTPAHTGPVEKFVVIANRTQSKPTTQWTAWLALAWLLGASAMLGRASVKVAGAEQLRRSCQPLNDSHIAELVAEARRAVKLTRQVRLAVTNQLTSPAVVGVLVPTLILPLSLITTLTPEQLRFILLHELAHIRRGDYLANLFQLFAEALFFFNPAVWWLSHEIRREREACCDALAIELSGAPADYARTLVSVAETILNPSPAAAPAFGNDREPSSLADRIQRVLVPGYRPSLRLTWRAMLAALLLGGGLLGLLAAGTRETIAATAALLEPQTNAVRKIADESAEDIAYRMWQHELALVGQTNRKDSVAVLLREIEESPFMEAFSAWRQVNKAWAEQRGTNTSYSGPQGGVTESKTGRFIPTRLSALQCRLGQEAHLHEAFLLKELAADAEVHMILESSPQLCEKYGIHSMALVRFIPGQGYVSRTGNGWSPQVQQSLWLKAMTNASSPSGEPANGSQTNNSETNAEVSRLINLGKLAYEMGNKDEADKRFQSALSLDSENATAKYFLASVKSSSQESKPTQTNEGRRQIVSKLESIRVESVRFHSTPLNQVVLALTEEAKRRDAEKRGINFLITEADAMRSGIINPTAAVPLSDIPITLEQELKNASLREVLDAVVKGAPQMIHYTVEDYAVVISRTDTNTPVLHVRTFKVEPTEFTKNFGLDSLPPGQSIPALINQTSAAFRKRLKDLGVDLQPPKSVFYNDRQGQLVVRATQADLDTIEAALQALNEKTALPKAASSTSENANTNLYTRTFKVDLSLLAQGLDVSEKGKNTNLLVTLREFFNSIGVGLHPPKSMFLNERTGALLVRSSLADLEIIEQALSVVNTPPPQVHIQANFVEFPQDDMRAIGFEWFSGTNLIARSVPGGASTGPTILPQADGEHSPTTNQLTGILTPAQYKVVLRALEQREKLEVLSFPSVTTVSGRQAQLQVVDTKTTVTNMVQIVTNGVSTNVPLTSPMEYGPVLDVIPQVALDGHTIQMTVIFTPLTEFFGIEGPGEFIPDQSIKNNPTNTPPITPLPRIRSRQANAQVTVWDGQTIVIGGFSAETVTRKPDGSETRKPDDKPQKKQLFVFITPTLVDPAGNRVHPDN